MFDWSDEELGDIIWGDATEVDDHVVPYPKGNEGKPVLKSGDHRKKQCIQDARHVKLADQKVSDANRAFSGFKPKSGSQCSTNEAHPAPGEEIDSWPDSPLTNVSCDGEYAGRDEQKSIDMQISDYGIEMPKSNCIRADAARLDDGIGFFGHRSEDKDHNGFLEYSWDNVGTFDDLDNMFRNDDPIFGGEGLGNGELWSSSSDLFSGPTESFSTCSPNSIVNVSSMSEHEMKQQFLQQKDLSHIPVLGRTDHFTDTKTETAVGEKCCQFVDSIVDCVGRKSTLLEEKPIGKMIETTEASKTNSTSEVMDFNLDTVNQGKEIWIQSTRVNGKQILSKYPTKEEESSSQDLHGLWSLTAKQCQPFGGQFTTTAVLPFPSSVSSQNQPVGAEHWFYWQTSHPYMYRADDSSQHPMMSTLRSVHPEKEKHQPVLLDCGSSPGSLEQSESLKVFPAPSRPQFMTPQVKLDKLKWRQQMQAMLAIQEQQQQFGHKVLHSTPYSAQKCPEDNQHQDTEGSTIEIQDTLEIPPSIEANSPIECNDFNTVAMVVNDCSIEERLLDQLQDAIGKLDIKARLCIRNSLFRLAQSAMQRHTNMDTSSTNNYMQCEGVPGKDEAYGLSRLPRIPEVEPETNPIDRSVAHLLFQPPLESSTIPVKDSEESASFTKLIHEPVIEGIKKSSEGCLSDCSIDKRLLQLPFWGSDNKDTDQLQSSTCIDTRGKMLHGEPEDCRE